MFHYFTNVTKIDIMPDNSHYVEDENGRHFVANGYANFYAIKAKEEGNT